MFLFDVHYLEQFYLDTGETYKVNYFRIIWPRELLQYEQRINYCLSLLCIRYKIQMGDCSSLKKMNLPLSQLLVNVLFLLEN